ncbi:MAG: site-specific integrase [Thermodesulfobacteriota bacterium]
MSEKPRKRQLYTLSEQCFAAPSFVDHAGRLHSRPASDLPLMIWPDGSWCSPANTFMRELFEKGLSRRNRGGSLAVAAANLTHLLRYCWGRRTDPRDLTDNQFREFISRLIEEPRSKQPDQKTRDANSVITIGRTCMQFLDSVGRHMGDNTLIGPDGRIRAQVKQHQVKIAGRGPGHSTKTIHYWDHPALPKPNTKRKRPPIPTAAIEDMRKAVAAISTTSHLRMRRHTTLKLLEITGARRGEIAGITVESVQNASRMEIPMLLVPTLKKRGGQAMYRYLPISRADIAFILQYAEIHRRPIIRRKLKGKSDHGILLVNGVTGGPLQPNSITQEIRQLAQAAKIKGKACPHMFRHRFLTKLFVALIEQHNIENTDQFRRLLIDGEELKQKVAEWSGHSSLESLDHYIDLAFDEVGNYKRVYHLVSTGLAIDSFIGTIQAEMDALENGESPFLIGQRLIQQMKTLKLDLENSKTE